MEDFTVLEQQIIKAEILNYLRTEQRLQTALKEDNQRSVSFLHNKMLVIFNDVCRHYKISKSWLLEQITYNKENHILKSGGNVTFKQISN